MFLLTLHMSIMTYVLSLMGNPAISVFSLTTLSVLALRFLLKPNRKSYIFLTERVTPLVYIAFSIGAIL